MGVFNKLKNIFYDEVEVDEEEETEEEEKELSKLNKFRFSKKEPKVEIEETEEIPKIEEIKFDITEELPKVEEKKEEKTDNTFNERDLFRSERTFNFVDFNDEEEEEPELPKRNVLNDVNRSVRTESVEEEKRVFKPSPTISPVWGILDKDYKKDEIKTKTVKPDTITASVTSYDSVRRKAYGTLEDELEDTLNSMDNKISTDTINKEINSVDKDVELLEQKTAKIENLISKIEEETDALDKTMSIGEAEDKVELENFDDEEEVKEEKKEDKLDNTLEHDLFNLIDSMYDEED